MKPANNQGIKRVIRATGFSIQGLKSAWKNEAAFRQELVLAAIMLPIALFVDASLVERPSRLFLDRLTRTLTGASVGFSTLST